MHRVLSNPIYYGLFEYGGERYEGTHEPILTTVQTDGSTGYYSIMLARKDSGITSFAGLTGKKLATNPQALEMNFKGIFLDEGKRILNAGKRAHSASGDCSGALIGIAFVPVLQLDR